MGLNKANPPNIYIAVGTDQGRTRYCVIVDRERTTPLFDTVSEATAEAERIRRLYSPRGAARS